MKATILMLLFVAPLIVFGQWTQIGTDIDGESADDWSGFSVSISADGLSVAIGAFNNDGSGIDAGHVRVYKLIGGVWTQQGVDIDGEAASDFSGISVAMNGDGSIVAIGATGNDGSGLEAGHVRVYKFIGGLWTQQGADIDGEAAYDSSGWKISLSTDGLTVAIATDFNDGAGVDAGHVRVYKFIGGVWTQQGADIDGEAAGDQSGYSVSMSSDGLTVAIGANQNDGNGTDAGHVRVYKFIGGVWIQQGADIDGEAAGDNSGWSVSLSADGLTVAIGAIGNDDAGVSAGHVRVYQFISNVWTQQGTDIDGEAAGDLFGFSVSISSDSSTLAIGGYRNDGNGTNAGHVRVYTDTSLGVDGAENIHQFAIYPNPSNGLLHLSGITEETRIQIYSLKGEKLFEQTASNNIEINVKLNSGLYLVRFNLFNNSLTKKLIIN